MLNCPICNSSDVEKVFLRKNQCGSIYMHTSDSMDVDIVLCKKCNFTWNSIAFDDALKFEQWISAAYTSYNLLDNTLHDFPIIDERSRIAKKTIENCLDMNVDRNILEIGSNRGDFLASLQLFYPQNNYLGIETTPLSNTGVPTIFEDVRNIRLSSNFDLIILRQVLEHIAQPVEFLNHIKSFLHAGGFLFIEVPDLENDLNEGSEVFITEHVAHYSQGSFEHLAKLIGMNLISINRDEQLIAIMNFSNEKSKNVQVPNLERLGKLKKFNINIQKTKDEWFRYTKLGYELCFYGASNVFLAISGILQEDWNDHWTKCNKKLYDDFSGKYEKIINDIPIEPLKISNNKIKKIFIICAMSRVHRAKMLKNIKNYVTENDEIYTMWEKVDL